MTPPEPTDAPSPAPAPKPVPKPKLVLVPPPEPQKPPRNAGGILALIFGLIAAAMAAIAVLGD